VQTDVRATADGYYPYTGSPTNPRLDPPEAISADWTLGEFDPRDQNSLSRRVERSRQSQGRRNASRYYEHADSLEQSY
jgi:hypothetical protein